MFLSANSKRIFAALIAAIGWFALIGQGAVHFTSGRTTLPELTIRFFSFFTILTNLLVAVCTTALALAPESSWGRYFSKASVGTAITTYIVVVGIVYNTLLIGLIQMSGLYWIVDRLLHIVIPILFLLFWIAAVSKKDLQWKDAFPWLIYPALYAAFVIVRGHFSKFYPYPFIDAGSLGYPAAVRNAGLMFLGFFGVSLLFIGAGKLMSKA